MLYFWMLGHGFNQIHTFFMVRGGFFFHHIRLRCYTNVFCDGKWIAAAFKCQSWIWFGDCMMLSSVNGKFGNTKCSRSRYSPGINLKKNGRWWTAVYFHIEMLLISWQHFYPWTFLADWRHTETWNIKASTFLLTVKIQKYMPSAVEINLSLNHANFALIRVS